MVGYGLLFTYKTGRKAKRFFKSQKERDDAFLPWKKKLNSSLGRKLTTVESVMKISE